MMSKHKIMAVAVALLMQPLAASAQQYDDGASDTEIKLGETMPYSGPASSLGEFGRVHTAFFEMINDKGGVNGRKISLNTVDVGMSPPKALAETRRMVEREKVLAIFSQFGTGPSMATREYLNSKGIPQLFSVSGAGILLDAEKFPYTTGWLPQYDAETRTHAEYINTYKPEAKIAILYQNDDFGKELLALLTKDLEGSKATIVASESYELSDATVDQQIATLQQSGADMLILYSFPKFTAQALRRAYDIGWRPDRLISQTSVSVSQVLDVIGPERSEGVIGAAYAKDPADPRWEDDPAIEEWRQWMKDYYPEGTLTDTLPIVAYVQGQVVVEVLRKADDNLTRENIKDQSLSLDFQPDLFMPGVRIVTGPDDTAPIEEMPLSQFRSGSWQPLE